MILSSVHWLQVTYKALYIIWCSWFLKLGVVCKKLMVWLCLNVEQCPKLAVKEHQTWEDKKRSRTVDNHATISVQKIWSKPIESSRADAKGSFETGKKNLVIDSIKSGWNPERNTPRAKTLISGQRSSKSSTEKLSPSLAFSTKKI